MQFFSLYTAFQLYLCLANLFITAIIFSSEEGELGKKRHIRIGVMSDFVKGEWCHWCEWKETLQGKNSSVAGNSVGRRGWRKPSLPSPCCNSSSSRAAPLLLPETQAPGTGPAYTETCFWQMALENFDMAFVDELSKPWKQRVHGWEHTPINCTGFRDTWFRMAAVSRSQSMCWEMCTSQQLLQVWKSPL